VAQAVPDLFLGLLVIGDGKGFELIEPDFLGSVSFDEARATLASFNRCRTKRGETHRSERATSSMLNPD
jgi:hypothetical protein